MTDPANVPVFILAGGYGTRMGSETELRPKPMVTIGGRPVLWHIMRKYRSHGFKRFVVCAGYQADVIKRYFLELKKMGGDVTVDLAGGGELCHPLDGEGADWLVTVADTGEGTETGDRLLRAADRYLGSADCFAVTYGDGLTGADLAAELDVHDRAGCAGTVLGINVRSRFGELELDEETGNAKRFLQKPIIETRWVNGGYFFFDAGVMGKLIDHAMKSPSGKVGPLEDIVAQLALEGELHIFRSRAFWACMDTQRERAELEEIWKGGSAPWAPREGR